VQRRNTQRAGKRKIARLRGAGDLASLIRKPAVQVTLVAAAVVQFAAVQSGQKEQGMLAAFELSPVTVSEPNLLESEIAEAWRVRAVERESERLLAEYRSRGYRLTPTLAHQISEAAVEQGIEPALAFGLVRAESSFRNQATSRVGAVGLTQLMPRTASWMEPGVTRAQLRDPETNLRIGMRYLRYLLDKYEGDETLALTAYNRGPGTVDRALRRGASPDNGYADFVYGNPNHGHRLFTR
jgi:soluble lytic murein transglycosylase-like protein